MNLKPFLCLYKLKTTVCLVIACTLTGCLGIIDESYYKPVIAKPENEEIIGHWKLVPHSYDFIKKHKVYQIDSISLFIRANKTFKAINYPDLVAENFGRPLKGKLWNATGTWELDSNRSNLQTKWSLGLTFDKGKLFKTKTKAQYFLFRPNNALVLLNFIGDPDSGNILVFEKLNIVSN